MPGLPSTRPYPNCCRWHLTHARCRYKWEEPSICAPFSIKVSTTESYSPRKGTWSNVFGVRAQLHSPIDIPEVLPAILLLQSTIDTELVHASPVASSSSSSPSSAAELSSSLAALSLSPGAPSPSHAALSQSPASQPWYAITKGRSICVVQGWCVTYS